MNASDKDKLFKFRLEKIGHFWSFSDGNMLKNLV